MFLSPAELWRWLPLEESYLIKCQVIVFIVNENAESHTECAKSHFSVFHTELEQLY